MYDFSNKCYLHIASSHNLLRWVIRLKWIINIARDEFNNRKRHRHQNAVFSVTNKQPLEYLEWHKMRPAYGTDVWMSVYTRPQPEQFDVIFTLIVSTIDEEKQTNDWYALIGNSNSYSVAKIFVCCSWFYYFAESAKFGTHQSRPSFIEFYSFITLHTLVVWVPVCFQFHITWMVLCIAITTRKNTIYCWYSLNELSINAALYWWMHRWNWIKIK